MGSGGGNATTITESGLADKFAPYFEKALDKYSQLYEKNMADGVADATVAGIPAEMQTGLDEQKRLAGDMLSGTGIFDYSGARKADLENIQGSSAGQASAGGALGSARSQKAMYGALGDKSLDYQKLVGQTALGGTDLYGKVGSTMRDYQQQRLDAPYTETSRIFGFAGMSPTKSTSTQSGGGK